MKVEIYIQGERLDLFEDESINVKQVTQDLKDISKIFSDYSQSFNIPASKRNNRILKNWFNADIDNGFDARTRVQATITINTLDFKHGKIRLDGASIENNMPTKYKLTFFGNAIKIKDLLGEDELSDLEWLDNFNHSYSGNVVKTGLTAGLDFTVDGVDYDQAVIYPLISYQRQWYYNSDASDDTNLDELVNIAYNNNDVGIISGNLKPAIKINLIIQAIQEKYGIIFNSPFFDSAIWNNIYVNLNKETETLANGSVVYEDVSGTYEPSGNIIGCEYRVSVTPNSGFEDVPYKIRLTVNGNVEYESSIWLTGTQVKASGVVDYEGEYDLQAEVITEQSFEFDSNTRFEVRHLDFPTGLTIDTVFTNSYTSQSIALNTTITSELPDIKVYEFITNIFKTFNLVATANGEDIYIQSLQDWYSEGQIYDVTKWVDLKTEEVSRGKIYKDITFKFQKSDQVLWDEFNQSNNQGYGDLELSLSSIDSLQDIDGETLEIESIFENPIFERLFDINDNSEISVQYCPYFDRERKPISGNMFMFFGNLTSVASNSISFINDGTEEELSGSVFMPSHSYVIDSSSFNLNFNSEINEYTSQVFQNTIYKEYWDDYITDMFSIKRRMYKLEAIFPDYFLNQLKLNDRLIIKDRRYIINSISSNLTKRKDTLELVNDIYDAPLASDTLNTSLFAKTYVLYPSAERAYSAKYIGLDGQSISTVDLGDGAAFITVIDKDTVGSVTNINFELDENNTGLARSVGIQVTDGVNNPIHYVIQDTIDVVNLADDYTAINLLGDSTLTYNDGVIQTTSGNNTGSVTRPRIVFGNLTVGNTYNLTISHTVNSGTLNWAFYNGSSYEVNGSSAFSDSFSFTVGATQPPFLSYDGQNNNFDITTNILITE